MTSATFVSVARSALVLGSVVLAAPALQASDESQPDESQPVVASVGADGTSLAAALEQVAPHFDADEAFKLLEAIDPFYRVRGNQGYMRSLERAFLMAKTAGFSDPSEDGGASDTVEFKDYGPVEPAWTPVSASLEVISPDVGQLHGFETEAGLERTFLCVNSFPTGEDGVIAPLVSYEHSKPVESYAGTVVYGPLPSETLFDRAVRQGGALGIISGYLPEYNEPDVNDDAIRYSKVPYDAERQGFGLNVAPNKRELLERLLDGGMVYVKVQIQARFSDSRSRTMVARIAGSDPRAGTVAVVAHLDEPGANDNASGVATTVAMASGMLRAIRKGQLPRPKRSITFLIGTEFECSREWLRSVAGNVDMALIVDMVGESLDENGAEALVERMPDPGAIWDRPPLDVHSDWGRSDVRESDLEGNFLNDYVMAAMRVQAQRADWHVRSNPYEGGSDHVSFLDRGIPVVLLWHFTDPYYHTNLDRVDKVSKDELANVALPTMALLHHFGQGGLERGHEVLEMVMAAARKRLTTEAGTARDFLSAPAVAKLPNQRALVADRERTILVAWSHWYREAVLSIEEAFGSRTVGTDGYRELEGRIDAALTELRELEHTALEVLEEEAG